MTETATAPLLGRCKEKGCDFVLFLGDSADAVNVAGFREVKGNNRAYRVGNNGFFSRCPNNHKFFPMKRIKGKYSKDHKCDARCLNAKGNDCTCSCGGANHGRGYAVEVREVAAPQLVNPCAEIVADERATEKQEAFIRSLLNERELPQRNNAGAGCAMPASADERREQALRLLDTHGFTKKQASATIKWLLELPKA